jgi:hypothetical protein
MNEAAATQLVGLGFGGPRERGLAFATEIIGFGTHFKK